MNTEENNAQLPQSSVSDSCGLITMSCEDNEKLMSRLKDESVDIICIDPPYLYLKNQKLEREFDEIKFFEQCKRILTKKGFIIMFGRGVSFYRMNCILSDLGFNFKEEIIWDKTQCSSPMMSLSRVHETISIYAKSSGVINKVKVPYLDVKSHDLDSIVTDIKRIKVILKNTTSLDAVLRFIETNIREASDVGVSNNVTISSDFSKEDRNVSTLRSISQGMNEKSIIRTDFKTPNTPRKGVTADPYRASGDRQVNAFQAVTIGMNEKSIIKQNRDHYTAIHPTQKPVRLLERLLMLCVPNKPKQEIIVADFFGGSFSTMEAVYNLGFSGITCEIDREYYEKGLERIKNITNQQKLF